MLEQIFFGNSLKDWGISLIIIASAFVINKCIVLFNRQVIKKITERNNSRLDDLLSESLERPLVLGIMLVAIWVAVHRLSMDAKVDNTIGKAYQILTVINITWFISKFVSGLMDEYGSRRLDSRLQPLIRRGFGIAIWIVGIVTALSNVGVEVTTLLGALGVGGMAVALAAQDTIKNIFGGITIYTDGPFRIGDYIKFDGFEGYVQDIGLRSTRIKTMENRIVTVPNFKLMDASVVNVTAEPSRKGILKLGLTYDTTSHKMAEAIAILKALPQSMEELEADTTVYFSDFGDFALIVTFWYYIKKGRDIYEITSKVNLEVLSRFNAAGLNFAFPTQTVYLEKLKMMN
ncbi:MAG: mechanosensitive ion channel [Bacteroidales bacterium]|jgi:MscS family membrane protein|nr:mechanosensitive ion channel [Bacteroidales bacterium]